MYYPFLDLEMSKILVTGSGGLIGSEVVHLYAGKGWDVHGIDNNMRADFFGPRGDTGLNQISLKKKYASFCDNEIDIRDRHTILEFVNQLKPDAIVHTAAQPSHELAALRPFDDFDINAVGTLNLLEANRQVNPGVPFIHLSSNKVYGDAINELNLMELDKRWDYADPEYYNGISEDFRVDQSKHSLFGASKLSSDILVQEYGRYFDMPSCCLRGGCLTGKSQSGVELHGFLNYLIKCNLEGKQYRIFGYKGKQVRDNIHSYDVARFIEEFIANPRKAEVYNIGGGRDNSVSILEAISMVESISGKKMIFEYVDKNREGDHICYISNLSKIKNHYPRWSLTKDLHAIFEDICDMWGGKNQTVHSV